MTMVFLPLGGQNSHTRKKVTLSLRINFRVLSQELSCSASRDTSELHFSKFLLELFLSCQLRTLEISLVMVLLKTADPFLFK